MWTLPMAWRQVRFTRRAGEGEGVFMSKPSNEESQFKRGQSAEEERRFLAELLDRLADECPSGRDALLDADPAIVEQIHASSDVRGDLAAALSGKIVPLTPEQTRLAESTEREIARRGMAVASGTATPSSDERSGILTSLTRHLSPEKAMLLYRKIAPVFVYQILNKLDESASLREVHRFVDHLCSEPVLARLANCEHVRDGILEELRDVLGTCQVELRLSRRDLQGILEECGAVQDLVAMENCIRLAASKAG
jgi:hypothetical protein